jgi:hypothetical protein
MGRSSDGGKKTGSDGRDSIGADIRKECDRFAVAKPPPLSRPTCSQQVESKIVLDYTEFNAATPGTLGISYTAVSGGTSIRQIDFYINFRQWPPPGTIVYCTTTRTKFLLYCAVILLCCYEILRQGTSVLSTTKVSLLI